MKKVIWGLMIVLLTALVNAAYLPTPDALFAYKSAYCDEKGIITLNLTHQGKEVSYADISFVIENEKIKQPLLGVWYRGDFPITNYENPEANYTGSNYLSALLLHYITEPGIYTAGKYTITLSWPSNTEYYNHIQFAVTCPGIACTKKEDCIMQQQCKNNLCEWTSCDEGSYAMGHTCYSKCDDNNKCTKDYYADAKCVYIPIDYCCNTNNECKTGFICKKNACVSQISNNNLIVKFWNWLISKFS